MQCLMTVATSCCESMWGGSGPLLLYRAMIGNHWGDSRSVWGTLVHCNAANVAIPSCDWTVTCCSVEVLAITSAVPSLSRRAWYWPPGSSQAMRHPC
jgi:hypothetical protein